MFLPSQGYRLRIIFVSELQLILDTRKFCNEWASGTHSRRRSDDWLQWRKAALNRKALVVAHASLSDGWIAALSSFLSCFVAIVLKC